MGARMKRSHAVLIIAESLIEPRNPDDPMKEADAILKKLETIGMLPPYRKRTRREKQIFEGINQYDNIHSWEKE
jgi:hypothetical protein